MELGPAAAFFDYWEKVRGRTSRVVDRIPPERLEWSWQAGKFSLGDLVRHLGGIERYMYAENAQRKPSRYPGHGRALADGWEAVRAFLEKAHEESMAIFRGLSPDALAGKCATPEGTPLTTWKWLRMMPEHEIHHRGQIYTMLGMLNVPTPPLYGMTATEVQERGQKSDG